jgi:hypothetical protein
LLLQKMIILVMMICLFFLFSFVLAETEREGCLACLIQPPPRTSSTASTTTVATENATTTAPALIAPSRFVWCASFCANAPNVPARRTCRLDLCASGEELVEAQPFRSNASCALESSSRSVDISHECARAAATRPVVPAGEFDWLVFILVFVSLCAFVACLAAVWLVIFIQSRAVV